MIEDVFIVGYTEQKERVMTTIIIVMVGASIDIGNKGRPNTLLVPSVDSLAKFSRFMDARTQRGIVNSSSITPIVVFVRKYAARLLINVCFEKALEPPLTKQRMIQSSQLYSSSPSPKLEPRIPTPSEQSAANDSNEEM